MSSEGKDMEQMVLSLEELKEFQEDYYNCPGGKYSLEVQVPHLLKLAEGYSRRYQCSGNWTDMLKAHGLFNSIGVRRPTEEGWAQKAYQIQQQFWRKSENVNFDWQREVVAMMKRNLESIRSEARERLTDAERIVAKFGLETNKDDEMRLVAQFEETVKEISISCTRKMVGLTKTLLEKSVNALIQQPPCAFCVVAIGSLAKGEATPYSDLEYLFLIERKDEETENYFEKLAITNYFLIGSLRETPLDHFDIKELTGWFDDCQRNGYKFDGLMKKSGNIPTGNGSTHARNHFIVTYDELLYRYKEVLDTPKQDAKCGDLTAMLQYTEPVFLHGKQADKLLSNFKAGKACLPSNKSRDETNREMFLADVKKYNFKADQTLIGKGYTVNSKKELYRYPSIVLFNISILVNFCMLNSWDSLSGLRESGVISSSLHASLSFLLICACYFRLSAYLYHDSHDDRLSVLATSALATASTRSTTLIPSAAGRRWFLPQELFTKHCEHSILVKGHIGKCTLSNINAILKAELPTPNWLTKFQVYHCCNRWADALKIFTENSGSLDVEKQPERILQMMKQEVSQNMQELWSSVRALSYSLFQYRKWKVALSYHSTMQHMLPTSNDMGAEKTHRLILADILQESGDCYNNLQEYDMATEAFSQTLEIRQSNLESHDELIALAYYNLGSLNRLRHFDIAEQYTLKALQLAYVSASMTVKYDYYGDPIPQDILLPLVDLTAKDPIKRLQYLNNASVMLARILWVLGRIYFASKRFTCAFQYLKKTRSFLQELYGAEAYHREMGSISLNYGMACDAIGLYKEADISIRRAMAIYTRVGSNKDGELYEKLLSLDIETREGYNAGNYYEFAINCFLSLPGYKTSHPQTAAVLRHYCFHIIHMTQHELAERLLKRCLTIYKIAADEGGDHREFTAHTLSLMALNCWKTKRYDEAVDYYNAALEMGAEATQAIQINAAEILQNMGLMYIDMKQYLTARSCTLKALNMYQKSWHSMEHPKITEAMEQLQCIQNIIARSSALQEDSSK